jgi:hypothetical protein
MSLLCQNNNNNNRIKKLEMSIGLKRIISELY